MKLNKVVVRGFIFKYALPITAIGLALLSVIFGCGKPPFANMQ